MKTFSSLLLSCLVATIATAQEKQVTSILEILDVTDGTRTVVKEFPYRVEAPNWTPDGQWLVYNSGGKLYKISPDKPGEPELIPTGFATRCNNDHVIAADGQQIAISHATKEDRKSRIYTLPFAGGTPHLVTPLGPSYLHGWSPDGQQLAYCAERNGNYDVYVIPAEGGEETRLTTAEGLDDGPEYSPCGRYIWFNSVRTGLMQLWRMKRDGSEQTQMTFDETRNSWFPHVSPDGKLVLFITYRKGDLEPGEHLPNKHVELRLMPAEGGEPRTLVKLFGGFHFMPVRLPFYASGRAVSWKCIFLFYPMMYFAPGNLLIPNAKAHAQTKVKSIETGTKSGTGVPSHWANIYEGPTKK